MFKNSKVTIIISYLNYFLIKYLWSHILYENSLKEINSTKQKSFWKISDKSNLARWFPDSFWKALETNYLIFRWQIR